MDMCETHGCVYTHWTLEWCYREDCTDGGRYRDGTCMVYFSRDTNDMHEELPCQAFDNYNWDGAETDEYPLDEAVAAAENFFCHDDHHRHEDEHAFEVAAQVVCAYDPSGHMNEVKRNAASAYLCTDAPMEHGHMHEVSFAQSLATEALCPSLVMEW